MYVDQHRRFHSCVYALYGTYYVFYACTQQRDVPPMAHVGWSPGWDSAARREGKGKEGKERKGNEMKGKERKGKEGQARERERGAFQRCLVVSCLSLSCPLRLLLSSTIYHTLLPYNAYVRSLRI